MNNVFRKTIVLLSIFGLIFLGFSYKISAQNSICFDKTTGQFTTWSECFGGIYGNYGQHNLFSDNPLYKGFGTFYENYWVAKYNEACGVLNTPPVPGHTCENDSNFSNSAAVTALNKTTNRLLADVFFAIISFINIIFVIKLIIAIMKYASAGDSEEVVKTQKKVIRSMLFGVGIIIVFLIVGSILTNILGIGNFWDIGVKIKVI